MDKSILILDIGGEGRHGRAWNLNPSSFKTIGPNRGAPIPRLILGRADAIPLSDNSVSVVVAERTPLSTKAFAEIKRVIHGEGTIILRHALPPRLDPHRTAYKLLPGQVRQSRIILHGQRLQETVFRCGNCPEGSIDYQSGLPKHAALFP